MNAAKQPGAAAAAAFRVVHNSKTYPGDPPAYKSHTEAWELDCGGALLTGTIQAAPCAGGESGQLITLHINDCETTLDDAAGIVCDFYMQSYSIQVAQLALRDIYIDDNDGLGLIFRAGVFSKYSAANADLKDRIIPRLAGG